MTSHAPPRASASSREQSRWLFVDGAADFGGHEIMLVRLVQELSSQGRVMPVVLAREGSKLQQQLSAFAAPQDLSRIDAGPRRSLPGVLWRHLRDARELISVIRRVRPALCIVAEGCLLAQPVFTLVARLMRVPVVVYVPLVDESAHMGFGKGSQRDALVRHGYGNLPTAWLTITREQAEYLARWAGIRRPILTLPNTVSREVERLAGTATVKQGPEPGKPLRVLVLGRIEPHQKALDLLLDFLETSESLRGSVHVSLVGDGPYADEVRRRTAASGLLNELLSLHPWSDPVEVMASHDVLLIASRYEGVPLVMLEAMALGLPVVASDLPGVRAFLPREALFDVGDLRRAFELIQQLRNTASRDAMIDRNRQAFVAQASGAAFTAAVYELTDRLQDIAAGKTARVLPASAELKRTVEGHS